MVKEIVIPDLGEGIDEVDVGELHIKAGDEVKVDDILIVLETDKASMEIPATEAGVIKEILVEAGGKVAPGAVVARYEAVEAAAETAAEPPKTEPEAKDEPQPEPEQETIEEKPAATPAPKAAEPSTPSPSEKPQRSAALASPSVRRFARELGADLAQITGSGSKGRITREDVQGWVKRRLEAPAGGPMPAPQPEIDFSQWGPIETAALSKIRKASARNLQNAWQTIPHVTQYDKADITELEAFRKASKDKVAAEGGKLSVLPFIMQVVAKALQAFPDFNSSLDASGENLVHKQYIHLGIAVDTPNGLVVPVIRDVDQKSLSELARELVEVSQRTREKKVMPAELLGATFSISSLGGISGTGFSPIVNPPQVAIMGVSRLQTEPVWNGSEFVPRQILPFSVSYDHRVIDGALAARFTGFVAEHLSDIRNLLL